MLLEFLSVSRCQLHQRSCHIEGCLAKLSDEQIWLREHEVENAVGNLVLHLCGNVTEWICGGVGGQTVTRDRDAEFGRRDPVPRDHLVEALRETVKRADEVLAKVSPADCRAHCTVQGYGVTVLYAIYHVVEHFSEHTGQIISHTKRMTGQDLGFNWFVGDRQQLLAGKDS